MTIEPLLADLRLLVSRFAPAGAPTPMLDEHRLGADLGLDSVLLVELVLECEEHFGVKLALESLLEDDFTMLGLARAIAHAS